MAYCRETAAHYFWMNVSKKDVIRFPWGAEQEGEAIDIDADLNWNTTFFANQKRCAMRTLNLCVSCWHE